MVSTIVFFAEPLWLRLLLAGIGAGVTTYLIRFKTLTREVIAEIPYEAPEVRAIGASSEDRSS